MHRSDVEAIFELKKADLIRDAKTSTNPVAILLGGQTKGLADWRT